MCLAWGTLQRQHLRDKCAVSLSAPKKVRKCDGEVVPLMTEAKMGRMLMENVWNLHEEQKVDLETRENGSVNEGI